MDDGVDVFPPAVPGSPRRRGTALALAGSGARGGDAASPPRPVFPPAPARACQETSDRLASSLHTFPNGFPNRIRGREGCSGADRASVKETWVSFTGPARKGSICHFSKSASADCQSPVQRFGSSRASPLTRLGAGARAHNQRRPRRECRWYRNNGTGLSSGLYQQHDLRAAKNDGFGALLDQAINDRPVGGARRRFGSPLDQLIVDDSDARSHGRRLVGSARRGRSVVAAGPCRNPAPS